MKIEIIRGDITKLAVDAIVNAANNALVSGGGVCGAIHLAAGSELQAECLTLGGCETGEAKITEGYNLPAKYVIHTPGPLWQGGDHDEARLLANSYRNSLLLADEYGCKTIAFPSISTGIFSFPLDQAAKIAIATLIETADSCNSIEKVIIACFDDKTEQEFKSALEQKQ